MFGLSYLILDDAEIATEHRAKHVRVHDDIAVIGEEVIAAVFDVGNATMCATARTRLVEHPDLVADLVANERQQWIDEVGHEDLVRACAVLDWITPCVNGLDDDEVLAEIHPVALEAAERGDAALGRAPHIRDIHAQTLLVEARALYAEIGDPLGLAWAAFFLGRARQFFDPVEVDALMREALAGFRSLGLRLGEAWCVLNLGVLQATLGDDLAARDYFEEALQLVREIDDRNMYGLVLGELGGNAFHLGEVQRARALLAEAIDVQRVAGDEINLAGNLCVAASIDIELGDLAKAEQLLRDALTTGIRSDDDWLVRQALIVLAVMQLRAGDRREARRLYAATGWDVEPPAFMIHLSRSVIVRSMRALEAIVDYYADDARAGRTPGRSTVAREFLATSGTRSFHADPQ